MEIIIPKYICTRTYIFQNGISFSQIRDLRNLTYYVLQGRMSELWNNIVLIKNYEKLFDFAIKNNFIKDLDDFLCELAKENIILINKEFDKPICKYLMSKIKETDDNYNYFKEKIDFVREINNITGLLYLELTYKCNQKCKHCCNHKDLNEYEISFESAKKMIDEAYEKLGLYRVVLTGGECTLNRDFIKIAKYVKEKHLELKILTNAVSLYDDKELFNEIIDIYPSTVQVSLYSMNPAVHDNMTGIKGSQKKTVNVLKKLKQHNINLTITCFQSSYNFDSYREVSEFAKLLGAEFNTSCSFIYNNKNHNIAAKLNKDDMENFYLNTIKDQKIRNFCRDNRLICRAGTERISIRPNLDITPCPYFEYILGNYNSIDFSELKTKIIPKFQKKFIRKNLKECFNHNYCEYCLYCPTISLLDTGFLKQSNLICEDAQAYYNALKKQKLLSE